MMVEKTVQDERQDLGDSQPPQSRVESPKHDIAGLQPGDPRAQDLAGKRRAAREAGAALRRDFADREYWEELARARGLRLPQWHQRPEPRLMRRWLRTLGVRVEDYLAYAGERTLKDFAQRNELWPLRAWAGIVLEAVAHGYLAAAEPPAEDDGAAAR